MSRKTTTGAAPDIAAGRLPADAYLANFEADAKEPLDVKRALEAKDRSALGLNAPPDGLYFVEAVYP